MHSVALLMEGWRAAIRRRDAMPADAPGRAEAEADVDAARTAYHAGVAQSTAYYEILRHELETGHEWPPMELGTPLLGELVGDGPRSSADRRRDRR